MTKSDLINYFIERGAPFSIFSEKNSEYNCYLVSADGFRTKGGGAKPCFDSKYDYNWFTEDQHFRKISREEFLAIKNKTISEYYNGKF